MLLDPAVVTERDSGLPAAMGKYVPFARLGSGGMADIFLAVARGPMGFNKLAVIKQLRHEIEGEISHLDMFLDEARIAARLNHPNIVHTYEVGEANGKYFIAMEYLEGQSLRALTSRLDASSDGLDEPLIVYVATQVLKGLHCAHELCDFDGTPIGIVHRDVSPHNLYITYAGEVKVLDFGIAKAKTNSTQTETGVLKGKIRYMAPEQLCEKEVDRRADLFAFGVVLWELLARRPLFQGDAGAIMNRLANEDAPSVRSVNPAVSVELDRIVQKALRRERTERFATAEEMRMPLEELLRKQRNSEKDLARLMNGVFAATRDDVRERINDFLHGRAPEDDTASAPRHATGELPSLFGGSGPHSPFLGLGATNVTRIIQPAPWRGRLFVVAGAVFMSLGVILALGRIGHPNRAPTVTRNISAAAPAPARLQIKTTPEGALVELDGTPLARTPAEIELAQGQHALRVSLGGYDTETMVLAAAPNTEMTRTLLLRPTETPKEYVVAPPILQAPPRAPRPLPVVRAQAATPAAPKAAASAVPTLKIRPLDDSDSP